MTPLTAQDRCDRCGAAAMLVTAHEHPDVGYETLLWCSHCFTKHEDKLTPFLVSDFREKTPT